MPAMRQLRQQQWLLHLAPRAAALSQPSSLPEQLLTAPGRPRQPEPAFLTPPGGVDAERARRLRGDIASATSLQQLQRLLPEVAAADQPDATVRLMLQAVAVRRGQGRGSSSSSRIDSGGSSSGSGGGSSGSQEHLVEELLRSCDELLERQAPRATFHFQHVSAALWAWAQLGWWPRGERAGALRQQLLTRLASCRVDRELAGDVKSARRQLSRAVTACATLRIYNPQAWVKLRSMLELLAPSMDAADVACCAWGLARGRRAPRASARPVFAALLARADAIAESFSRVAALNVLWAVGDARVGALAPPGLLDRLAGQVLGPSLGAWRQWAEQQQQQQQHQQQQAAPERQPHAACGGCGGTALPPQPPPPALTPRELSCMVRSLACVARAHKARGPEQWRERQAARQPADRRRQVGRGAGGRGPAPGPGVAEPPLQDSLHQDAGLLCALAAAARAQLGKLPPRTIATLSRGFALLDPPSSLAVLEPLWRQALRQGSLSSFSTGEVFQLLQSLPGAGRPQPQRVQEHADLPPPHHDHHQQGQREQQQQQQGLRQGAAADQVSAAVLEAAAQRVLAAGPEELPPYTAAVLLHVFAKLRCFDAAAPAPAAAAAGGHGESSAPAPAAPAPAAGASAGGLALKLLHATSASGGLGRLRDKELVMVAAAAGQLAAAGGGHAHASYGRGGGGGGGGGGPTQEQLPPLCAAAEAAAALLRQLALPLAAASRGLRLGDLSAAVGSYAAAGVEAPELFDAASLAVQRREVLDGGGSWALARLLAAFAAAGHTDERLFAAVADELQQRLPALQARVVARLAWSAAAAGYHDPDLFGAIAAQLAAAAAAAGAATTPCQPASPASSAADEAEAEDEAEDGGGGGGGGLLAHFQARDVAAVAWAFGTVRLRGAAAAYDALAGVALRLLPHFTAAQLASLLWGMAAGGAFSAELAAAVLPLLEQQRPRGTAGQPGDEAQQQQQQQQQQQWQQQWQRLPPEAEHASPLLEAAAPQDVATLAWSLAEQRAASPGLLAACAAHFERSGPGGYAPPDAADLAWALVASGCILPAARRSPGTQRPGQAALVRLLSAALADTEQLTPQQLASVSVAAALAAIDAGNGADGGGSGGGYLPASMQQSLLEGVASCAPLAWSGVDCAKLLWAELAGAGAQRQPQPPAEGGAPPHGARAHVFSAGARAISRVAGAVCRSHFCEQVLGALRRRGLAARPVVAGNTRTAAAAAASAAEALAGRGGGGGARTAWDALGPEATAQLLGHVVVQPAPAGSCEGGAADDAPAAGCAGAVQPVPALLLLVPAADLSRLPAALERGPGQRSAGGTQAAAEGRLWPLPPASSGRPPVGTAAVAAALLLRGGQRHFRGVVLGEDVWRAWGAAGGAEAQAEGLARLLGL